MCTDPAIEKALFSEGKLLVEQSLKEHRTVEEEALQVIQMRKSGGGKLETVMKKLLDDFSDHLLKEEDDIMIKFLDKVSQSEMTQLADEFNEAKFKAPLDPQPMAA